MPTSVLQTVEYQAVLTWLQANRDNPQLQEQVQIVEGLLGCFSAYQKAKEQLFQPGPNGDLPLVTKELGQEICRKYDALMDYYKRYAGDLPKESSFTQRYDTPYARFIYAARSLKGFVDDLFDKLRGQDEDSVEFMRDHFRERTIYHQLPREANIQEIGDYCYLYPFHTAEEIELTIAQQGRQVTPRRMSFEDLNGENGHALDIFGTSVPDMEKSRTEKDENALSVADILAPQVGKNQSETSVNVQSKTKRQRKLPKKRVIRAKKKDVSKKTASRKKVSLPLEGVTTRSKAQKLLENRAQKLQKK